MSRKDFKSLNLKQTMFQEPVNAGRTFFLSTTGAALERNEWKTRELQINRAWGHQHRSWIKVWRSEGAKNNTMYQKWNNTRPAATHKNVPQWIKTHTQAHTTLDSYGSLTCQLPSNSIDQNIRLIYIIYQNVGCKRVVHFFSVTNYMQLISLRQKWLTAASSSHLPNS